MTETTRREREPIIPEPINLDATTPGYAPGHWDYPRRCANVGLALDSARERVEEWDPQDGHGWWHERTDWIALHNEVLRLRRRVEELDSQLTEAENMVERLTP